MVFWLVMNSLYGYRTMLLSRTQQTWDFANNLAAKLLVGMGVGSLVLAVIALIMIDNLPTNLLERAYNIAMPVSVVVNLLFLVMPVVIVQAKLMKMLKFGK